MNIQRIAIAAVIAAAALGSAGAASAAGVELNVGPRGVYVGPTYHHHWRHWRSYDYVPGCRVVVRRHLNRWGEWVTVRRRVCY